MTAMWEALVLIALGIGVSLIGRHYRKQYFRELDDMRAREDTLYRSNAQLLQRFVVVFLTAGAMMVLVGAYFALSEVWDFLRRG
jgi:hypothetical protein